MSYILMSIDNYNRDFHPDRIHKVSESKEELENELQYCRNSENSERSFKVVDENYSFNFESNYDLIDEVPTFKTFCQYTGCNLLQEKKALDLYIKQFKVKGYCYG